MLDLVPTRNVGSGRDRARAGGCEPRDGLVELGSGAGEHGQRRSLGRERAGDGQAQPAAPAGHERDLTFELAARHGRSAGAVERAPSRCEQSRAAPMHGRPSM